MKIEIKIPSPGESISEVEIVNWQVSNGDIVTKDQELAEIESDKATLPLLAEADGEINILAAEGVSIQVGSTACIIDTSKAKTTTPQAEKKVSPPSSDKDKKEESVESKPGNEKITIKPTPVAKKMMEEHNLSVEDIVNGLKKIGKNEVELVINNDFSAHRKEEKDAFSRQIEETKMTSLRRKLSERLVAVKNETAMLTTFNEVDMSAVMEVRKKYQKQFVDKNGIKVGLISFFVKAVSQSLNKYPTVNAMIDNENIVYHHYSDIGIAVQSAKGLLVPIIRNAESLSLAEIEQQIKDFGKRAQNNRIGLDEMTGGTFTITNGGTFGSLLSTPIINPPQSAILGMHNIVERPVAINGKVEIRPMMYVALSYDHRIIDGKSSVGFLKNVKDLLESPLKMLLGNIDPEKELLGL